MSSTKEKAGSTNQPPPQHIAIIMDGNGRWAKAKHLPRSSGHQKGVQTVRKIVKHCAKLGVNSLTLFAFSSENMKRSSEEVGLLFKLFLSVLKTETKKLKENNIKLKIIGDLSVFTPEIITLAQEAESSLRDNTGLNLVIAANYGGQWDIAESAKKIAVDVANGSVDPNNINTALFKKYTSLKDRMLMRPSPFVREG